MQDSIDRIVAEIEQIELQKKIYGSGSLGEFHPDNRRRQLTLEALRAAWEGLELAYRSMRSETESDVAKEKESQQKAAQAAKAGINESSIRSISRRFDVRLEPRRGDQGIG